MDILKTYTADTEFKLADRISDKVIKLVNQNLILKGQSAFSSIQDFDSFHSNKSKVDARTPNASATDDDGFGEAAAQFGALQSQNSIFFNKKADADLQRVRNQGLQYKDLLSAEKKEREKQKYSDEVAAQERRMLVKSRLLRAA